MFGAINVPAHPILLPIDLCFLGSGQVSAVQFAIGADFLIDGGFILLKTGRLAGAQLARRDALCDPVLLILAPLAYFRCFAPLRLQIGMLLFPQLTHLNLTGPFEVLSRLSETRVLLPWKSLEAVTSDTGMSIPPTSTFSECPQLDVVFVPGGPGQVALMEDDEVLGFLRDQAREAMYVTSVCTGSLVLAAAGLLKGRRAACHWMFRDLLSELGADVSEEVRR